MENAVVYARYSSHNQTDQSIEGQIAAAKEYADKKNYNIIKIYADKAKTGTNDNREEFQKMLRESSSGNFSVLILWKIDRFGRNREEIAFNKYQLRKNKVRVEYVAENISDGPEGVILESLFEGMAEYYSLQLSQNIKRGKLESAKKHHVVSHHPPLGYKTNDKKEYELDNDQASIVLEIFERYSQGYTMAEIQHDLNSRGYKTSLGNDFNKNSLRRILTNEIYIGTFKFKDQIREEDALPAIVSKELFYKVQERMQDNKRKPSNRWTFSDYLLSGKLICGDCESPMNGISGTSKSNKMYHYYACSNYRKHHCDRKPVRQDRIEEKAIDIIEDILANEKIMKSIVDATWQYHLNQTNTNNQKQFLERRLNNVNEAIGNLIKSIEKGIDPALVNQRISDLTQEKQNIEIEISKEKALNKIVTRESIELFLNKFANGDLTNRKVCKRLIETFINKIYLFEDRLVVVFNYSDTKTNTVVLTDLSNINESDSVRLSTSNWSMRNNRRTLHVINGYPIIIEEIASD